MKEEIGNNKGEIIIYQSEDGKIKLDVRLEEKTVWLTQEQIAQLYGKGRSTITEHISNIFKEGELEREKVCRKFRHTTQHGALEGKTQNQEVTLYNLDVIISVGYRVKSIVGTRFRQWATERLAEYIIKSFTMDDERLKNLAPPSDVYGRLHATVGQHPFCQWRRTAGRGWWRNRSMPAQSRTSESTHSVMEMTRKWP